MKSVYRNRIENYSGSATLMLRSAANLPREKRGFNRSPDTMCVLTLSDSSCSTEVIKNEENPRWNHACRITVQAGETLTFRIFEQDRGQNRNLIGELTLSKLPKNGKNITLKHKDGWALMIDVKRDR